MDFPTRRFSLHLYWSGHGSLLLRSGKSQLHPTRIDVLFKDVVWLALPVCFTNLAIESCALDEVPLDVPASLEREIADRLAFRLRADEVASYIICGAIDVAEDDADYFAKSQLLPGLIVTSE